MTFNVDFDFMIDDIIKSASQRTGTYRRELELRGNNLAVQYMRDKEIILGGPAGTGKSVSNLYKLHDLALNNPGMRGAIVRKTRATLAQSTLATFENFVLGPENPICSGVHRANRKSYVYPNGSEIVIGGLNNPTDFLSTEFDIIIAAEASELSLSDWEFLVMRLRPQTLDYSQIIGDTNPGPPNHWIKSRELSGTLKLLPTHHTDNPRYWNTDTLTWTPDGEEYVVKTLRNLTGVRRARYLEGLWVMAEGMVYDGFSLATHTCPRFKIPDTWKRYRSIDFGFTNPFSCSWWTVDPVYNRLYMYRQIYMSKRRVDEHARQINKLTGEERILATVADHDAEGRATLTAHGIHTIPARKHILEGLQAVQRRLTATGADGKPLLMFFDDALVEPDPDLVAVKLPLWTVDEMFNYTWHVDISGKSSREMPVDMYNHGLDELRYMCMYLENQDGAGSLMQIPVRQYGKHTTAPRFDLRRKSRKIY